MSVREESEEYGSGLVRGEKAKNKDVLITEVKKGDKIIYQVPDSEEWNTVT